jgi:hypothetical protein
MIVMKTAREEAENRTGKRHPWNRAQRPSSADDPSKIEKMRVMNHALV